MYLTVQYFSKLCEILSISFSEICEISRKIRDVGTNEKFSGISLKFGNRKIYVTRGNSPFWRHWGARFEFKIIPKNNHKKKRPREHLSLQPKSKQFDETNST